MSNGNGQSRIAIPGGGMPMPMQGQQIQVAAPMSDVQLVATVAAMLPAAHDSPAADRVTLAADIIADSVVLVNGGGLVARINRRVSELQAEQQRLEEDARRERVAAAVVAQQGEETQD